jgi:SAM-dependent MidA family methyltransferase
LYHPEYGYYQRRQPKIGKQGDYYTSSSVHPVFAAVFADVYAEICERHGGCLPWIEIGAGTGQFAADFLAAVRQQCPELYRQNCYLIVEKSEYHRQLQFERLEEHQHCVTWLDNLTEWSSETAVIYSNELLDAFPVHIVERRGDQLYEVSVSWSNEADGLVEKLSPLTNGDVQHYIQQQQIVLRNGQRLEIPIDHPQWVAEVAEAVKQGVWITIDYGYTHEELRQPKFRDGTLLCYDQHRVDDQPLLKPGEKDITFHIHFDTISAEARRYGWETVGLFRQNDFLLQAGILSKLEEHDGSGDPFRDPVRKKNRAVMQLISSEGLSQVFHVLLMVKGESALPDSYSFTKPFSYAD